MNYILFADKTVMVSPTQICTLGHTTIHMR